MLSPGADVTRVVMDTGEEAAPSASTSAPGGRGMEDGGWRGDLGKDPGLGTGEQEQLHRQVNAAVRESERRER